MKTKYFLITLIFLLFILGCKTTTTQQTETTTENQGQPAEKMAAMNVITYDSIDVTVIINELAFLPPFIHVKKGTKITWENRDKVDHTIAWHNKKTPTKVTESDVLRMGDKYTYAFNEEGIFDIF